MALSMAGSWGCSDPGAQGRDVPAAQGLVQGGSAEVGVGAMLTWLGSDQCAQLRQPYRSLRKVLSVQLMDDA